MKTFVYKSLLVCLLFFIMFHLTFGYFIRTYKQELYNTFSKDKILFLKEKLREEVKKNNEKENILYPEDAKIFGEFIRKILSELR